MKTACVLATAASLVASASAFAPTTTTSSTTSSTSRLNEFANGYVGGEGPEPIPFSSQQSSVNWDPAGFTEVCLCFVLNECIDNLLRNTPMVFGDGGSGIGKLKVGKVEG